MYLFVGVCGLIKTNNDDSGLVKINYDDSGLVKINYDDSGCWRASFHGSDVNDFVRIKDNAVKTSCTRELGLISQYIALPVR